MFVRGQVDVDVRGVYMRGLWRRWGATVCKGTGREDGGVPRLEKLESEEM